MKWRVVSSSEGITRLQLVGSAPVLGRWDIAGSVRLSYSEATGCDEAGSTTWESEELDVPLSSFPLRFRLVANAHRSSPNTRPLIWDSCSHVLESPPEDGVVRCEFEPTADSSDNGWVTAAGVGAYQLRVGQPPGSTEPLVTLEPHLAQQPFEVNLWEAKANDPAVPQGKQFARITGAATGVSDDTAVTYMLNSQSVEELAFRVDVTCRATGALLARCFVTHQTLSQLEGFISATLVTPDLQHAGTFRAAFLVVMALPHPCNDLSGLQRKRWAPDAPTLDIGHRGSGANKVQGHNVRENTLLSFQKAAANHTDYIEFDVHVTADGAVVVHHDFEVKLRLGSEVVKLGIPALNYQQLSSEDFTQFMMQPSEDTAKDALDEEKSRRKSTLQRNMSSAEDMFRSIFKPKFTGGVGSPKQSESSAARWFLADRIATLAEAFRRTPKWLGFNIELKYPTLAEVAAMRTHFYSRNHFVDAVLRVVLEEGKGRSVIFSTFDPDCATLLSLKQPRYPVLFLTCGGTKSFPDPRMNSLEAALHFALSSHLQGVVAEASSVLGRLQGWVDDFHANGLFLFTWGDINNDLTSFMAQREAGVDAVILDDVEKMMRATNKKRPQLFNKPMRSPASIQDLQAGQVGRGHPTLERISSDLAVLAISPIGSPSTFYDSMGLTGLGSPPSSYSSLATYYGNYNH